MTDHLPAILSASDAGTAPAAISRDLNLPLSTVYTTLRTYRPLRKRARRARTSQKRAMILGLLALGKPASRVAVLVGVKRQWVYRVADGAGVKFGKQGESGT